MFHELTFLSSFRNISKCFGGTGIMLNVDYITGAGNFQSLYRYISHILIGGWGEGGFGGMPSDSPPSENSVGISGYLYNYS